MPRYNDSDFRRKKKEGFTTPYQWHYPSHQSSDIFIPVVKTTDNATNNDIFWTKDLVDLNSPPPNGYFIGTINGVLRFYPGTEWPQRFDMYDVRQQSWFLEAASSKHDIAIVLDRSGSLYGRPLKTIKGIARLIIKLIPANYRFNVFLFNNETVPLKECLGMEPLPANESVKSAMLAELGRIDATQPGLFSDALSKLENSFFAKSNEDGSCQKMIILFTDGKIDFNLKDVQERLKRLKVKLLVLNFSSPSSFGPNKELEEMTCTVGGHYVFVNHIGDWFQVADMFFDTVCSRSVKNIEVVSPRWSDPIVTFYNKKSMTVSYPLFNKTITDNILQGVLGTEILLDDFVTDFSLEAGSLAFEIVSLPNGKVVSHPRLLASNFVPTLSQVKIDGNQILYPLDFMDGSPITKLRFPLIEETVDTTLGKMKFQMVVPENDAYNVSIRELPWEINMADEMIFDNYGKQLFIRPIEDSIHPFRFGDERISMFDLDACEKNSGYKTETLSRNCPNYKKYILPKVRDVILTKPTVNSWKRLKDKNQDFYTLGNFLVTRNGILWSTLPYYTDPVPKKVSEYLEFSADPNKFPEGTLLVSRPSRKNVHLSKSVSVRYLSDESSNSSSDNRVVLSVLGVGMKYPIFSAVVNKLREESELKKENYELYLLDHKGYIVHSSTSNQPAFFGDVNSAVFDILVRSGYYVKKSFKDCLCTEELPPKSKGQKLSLFVTQLAAKIFSMILALAVNSITLFRQGFSFIMPEPKITSQCCHTINSYERNFKLTSYQSNEYNFCPKEEKTHCTERYAVQPVPKTNLLLVLVLKRDNPNCNCKQEENFRRGPIQRVSECANSLWGVSGSLNADLCYDEVGMADLSAKAVCEKNSDSPTF